MKSTLFASIFLVAACGLFADEPAQQPPKARLVIGLEGVKQNASGLLTIKDGSLQFKAGKSEAAVPTKDIRDIFVGNETTQSGGKAGRVVKTAAIAAPFGSGKALTLLLRTNVDILTVVYHGSNGELHSAIFALPKGQAEPTRAELVAAGAHSSAPASELKERSNP